MAKTTSARAVISSRLTSLPNSAVSASASPLSNSVSTPPPPPLSECFPPPRRARLLGRPTSGCAAFFASSVALALVSCSAGPESPSPCLVSDGTDDAAAAEAVAAADASNVAAAAVAANWRCRFSFLTRPRAYFRCVRVHQSKCSLHSCAVSAVTADGGAAVDTNDDGGDRDRLLRPSSTKRAHWTPGTVTPLKTEYMWQEGPAQAASNDVSVFSAIISTEGASTGRSSQTKYHRRESVWWV